MPGLGLCAAGDLAKHFHLWKTKRGTGKKRKEKVKEKRMEGKKGKKKTRWVHVIIGRTSGKSETSRCEATSSMVAPSLLTRKQRVGDRVYGGPPACDVLFRRRNSPRRLPFNDCKPVPGIPVTPSFITTYCSRGPPSPIN